MVAAAVDPGRLGEPEFDSYAEGYSGGMEDPLKQLAGGSFEAFVDLKARWLLRHLSRPPVARVGSQEGIRLLDFGCGTGELLGSLRRLGFRGHMEGCDISEGMLSELRKRWRGGSIPRLFLAPAAGSALPESSYDVVVACCVFHHIPPRDRQRVLRDILGALRPAGHLVIFEHNPINPVTRLIVARAAIDRNAVLLAAGEACKAAAAVGFVRLRARYLLFLPPRWRAAHAAERVLSWLPVGGQYAIVAEKPPAS